MDINLGTRENQEQIIASQDEGKLTLEGLNTKVTGIETLVKALSESGGSVIKSIQRGTILNTRVAGGEDFTQNIESVNLNKSIIFVDVIASNLIVELKADQIYFKNINSNNAATINTSWQIIEFN